MRNYHRQRDSIYIRVSVPAVREALLYRISGVDFTQIDGFGALTVLVLLSEVGLDPRRFLTVKHFTSWLGLCPGSRVTGGKVKSSKTRPVTNRAATAFMWAFLLFRLFA